MKANSAYPFVLIGGSGGGGGGGGGGGVLTNYPMKLHNIKTMYTNITPEYLCLIFVV